MVLEGSAQPHPLEGVVTVGNRSLSSEGRQPGEGLSPPLRPIPHAPPPAPSRWPLSTQLQHPTTPPNCAAKFLEPPPRLPQAALPPQPFLRVCPTHFACMNFPAILAHRTLPPYTSLQARPPPPRGASRRLPLKDHRGPRQGHTCSRMEETLQSR